MPVVTVDPAKTERFELKTALADPNDPNDENGWVELRALPYGMKLTRRDKAAKMSLTSAVNSDAPVSILETFNEWAVAYDFAYCIVDHNLLDANHNKINFAKPESIKMLNPRVGSEIEKLVNQLNEDEDEESLRDFHSSSNTSSTTESTNSDAMDLPNETQTATS